MITALLASYVRMRIPQAISVEFVIVENNERFTLNATINNFRKQVGNPSVHYLLKTDLGIPFARNHALEFAIKNGFDYLTFVDDDEVVEPSWLVKLLAERDRGDFDIVGSPVRVAPIPDGFSVWNRVVWQGLNRMNFNTECRFVRAWRKGRADQLRVATGSWLGKVDFFSNTGLRFDANLGLAGGEDWRLWEEARKMGAKTSWTPYAVAYETIPQSRLQLKYCYIRDRDHARMEARIRMQKQPVRAILRLPGSILSRAYKLLIAVGSIPFTRGYGLVQATFLAGRIVGLFQGTFGMTSNHYKSIKGN